MWDPDHQLELLQWVQRDGDEPWWQSFAVAGYHRDGWNFVLQCLACTAEYFGKDHDLGIRHMLATMPLYG